jgi:hypothetical protein
MRRLQAKLRFRPAISSFALGRFDHNPNLNSKIGIITNFRTCCLANVPHSDIFELGQGVSDSRSDLLRRNRFLVRPIAGDIVSNFCVVNDVARAPFDFNDLKRVFDSRNTDRLTTQGIPEGSVGFIDWLDGPNSATGCDRPCESISYQAPDTYARATGAGAE